MANEFIARKGIVSLGNVTVTGSLTATNGFTGSFSGSTSAPGLTTQVTYNNNGVLSADSGFVYSGSRIGIGISTPAAKLDIFDSTNSGFYLRTSTAGANWITSTGNSQIGTYTNTPFVLKSNDTARVQIQGNGNVGIGTTSPTSTLQIKGSGTTSATTAFRVENANASGSMVVLDNGFVGIGRTPTSYTVDISGSFRVQNNSLGLLVNSDGSTQIDTTGGSNGLYINDIVYSILKLGDYRFVQNRGAKTLTIRDSADIDVMVFASGSKNVGIGTTTPAYKLDVSGSGNFTNNLTITGSLIADTATLTSFTASDATISGNVTVLGTASINTLIVNQIGYSSGSNQLGDAADDTQTLYGTVVIPTGSLTITGSLTVSGSSTLTNIGPAIFSGSITQTASTASFGGLVGIGITSPSNKLHVNVAASDDGIILTKSGSANNIFRVTMDGTNDRGEMFLNNGASPIFAIRPSSNVSYLNTGNNFGIGTTTPSSKLHVKGTGATSATTTFRTENSNALASMVVLDDGNVGIGIDTPTTRLDIRGGTRIGNGTITLGLGESSGDSVFVGSVTNYPLKFVVNTNEYMRILTNGNVGIGTATPTTALEVNGRVLVGGGLNGNALSVATSIGTYTLNLYSLNTPSSFLINTGGGGYFDVNTTGGNIRITPTGNVGIGTTVPTAKLQVKGSGTTNATTAFRVENANASGSMVVLDNGFVGIGSNTPQSKLYVAGGEIRVDAGQAITLDTSNGMYLVGASNQLRFYNNGLPRMVIENSNGNIGINTITPTTKLHVSGSARIDEVLTLTPLDPLPTGSPTGSFAVSASVPPIPYFYDGTSWNALY
jgi:hypothetical protein